MNLEEALAKIANTEAVKEQCEPNIQFHSEVNTGHVLRVLTAQEMLRQAWKEHEKEAEGNTGNNNES